MSDLKKVMERLNAQMPEEFPQPVEPVPVPGMAKPVNELREAVRAALQAMDGNGHIPGTYIRKLRELVNLPA